MANVMNIDFLSFLLPLLVTGIFSGVLAGLLGVGGGIIIVPVVYFILKFQSYSLDVIMHSAIASSLGVIVFTSMSSIYSHYRLKNINIIIVKKWLFGIIFGSIIGSILASFLSGNLLIYIFIFLAIIISINMFLNKKIIILNDIPKNPISNNIISFLIGYLSVMIGIGGGSFSVPILTACGRKIHEAVGTSATLGFFIALPGALIYSLTGLSNPSLPPFSIGYINLPIVLIISSMSIISAPFGANFSVRLDQILLKKIFAVFLITTCISLIMNQL